ncbi:hypothetical protein GCM10028819_18400 [Spirosoma humi]
MIALIVPAVAPASVPMTGELAENVPLASDNWAENVFDAANVPLIEKGTVKAPPGQTEVGEMVPVVIVWANV